MYRLYRTNESKKGKSPKRGRERSIFKKKLVDNLLWPLKEFCSKFKISLPLLSEKGVERRGLLLDLFCRMALMLFHSEFMNMFENYDAFVVANRSIFLQHSDAWLL